jgi:Meiotically Up-regulated Gene 113 (MUG113) protein/helix-turn-helix protein
MSSLNVAKEVYVYVIGPSGGPMKIGIADNCASRRSILNVGNHLYLRLWHFHKANDEIEAKALEKSLHYQYRAKHIRGEWFSLNEKDLPEIKQIFHNSTLFEIEMHDWSLEKKNCDEFTPLVCLTTRRALDLSQEDLANKADIMVSTLVAFENGNSRAQLGTLEALRDALERCGIEFVREELGRPMKVLVSTSG